MKIHFDKTNSIAFEFSATEYTKRVIFGFVWRHYITGAKMLAFSAGFFGKGNGDLAVVTIGPTGFNYCNCNNFA